MFNSRENALCAVLYLYICDVIHVGIDPQMMFFSKFWSEVFPTVRRNGGLNDVAPKFWWP